MICERVKEQIPEYLSGALEEQARIRLLGHLDSCNSCREEVAQLDSVWRKLGLLEGVEPSPSLRPRFQEMLAAYQAGVAAVERPQQASRNWLTFPAWAAVACATVLVLGGVAAGRYFHSPQTAEYSQLKGEIEGMRQLVTLSLLQQQSPGSRLRGVNYSYRIERPDPEIESALLYAVNHDSNVNVRLSALDALQKFAGSPAIGRALIDALPLQDSPLVQIGLIDLLVGRNEADATPVLQKLVKDPQSNPAVRQRAQWGLNKLGAA